MIKLILFFTLTLVITLSSAAPSANPGGHLREFENLRDLINPADAATTEPKNASKKPRRYKCVVIEDGDDDEEIANYLLQKDPQPDKNKFVFVESEDAIPDSGDSEDIVETVTQHPTPISVAPAPEPIRTMPTQQQLPRSAFLQTQDNLEKITEEEAAIEYPASPVRQSANNRNNFVTLPPASNPLTPRQNLRRVELPQARGFTAAERNNFPAATATLPPEIISAPRDSQNRPLILAPEHCDQIKHYAEMYGVSDVKRWVHGNCSFAQTYLPTASCEEIDILVGSCYRNKPQ